MVGIPRVCRAGAIIRPFRYYLPNRQNCSAPQCPLLLLILEVPLRIYLHLTKDLNVVFFAVAKIPCYVMGSLPQVPQVAQD